MAVFTDRYAMYLAAGGSAGTIPGDDAVDVDKLNDSFRLIDSQLGLPVVTRASVAAPKKWQLLKDPSDAGELYLYSSANTWVNAMPNRLFASALDAAYLRQDGFQALTDSRYYTQAQLLTGGVIDGRYVTRNSTGLIKQAMLPFKLDYGQTVITPSGTNGQQRTVKAVTFPNVTNVLAVLVTANSATPDNVQVSATAVTGAGCNLVISRNDGNVPTTVYYLAIGS